MIGSTKMILNDETIMQALQEHFNAHLVRPEVTVTKIDKVYNSGGGYEWVAYIEPVVIPVTETPKEPTP